MVTLAYRRYSIEDQRLRTTYPFLALCWLRIQRTWRTFFFFFFFLAFHNRLHASTVSLTFEHFACAATAQSIHTAFTGGHQDFLNIVCFVVKFNVFVRRPLSQWHSWVNFSEVYHYFRPQSPDTRALAPVCIVVVLSLAFSTDRSVSPLTFNCSPLLHCR